MKRVHIGRLVQSKFEESGMTKRAFADKIGLSVRHLYAIFEKDSLDTGLLLKMAEVLNHDFFSVFQQERHIQSIFKTSETGGHAASVKLKMEILINRKMSKKDILVAVKEELDQLL